MHIGSSIRYENALYGNYFLKYYIVKRILISFNCFSEYISLKRKTIEKSMFVYLSINCIILHALSSMHAYWLHKSCQKVQDQYILHSFVV